MRDSDSCSPDCPRYSHVGAVALEDARRRRCTLHHWICCGFHTLMMECTSFSSQTVITSLLHLSCRKADRGAARGAGTRERAAHQSAIGGGQTQATSGGRNAAVFASWAQHKCHRPALQSVVPGRELHKSVPAALPCPACVLAVVGRLGAAHS